MAIIEIIGGPITHKYLMGKTKHEIADMYMRLLRETARDAEDAARYRWLRNSPSHHFFVTRFVGGATIPRYEGETLDAAIDAAMHAPGGAGGGDHG